MREIKFRAFNKKGGYYCDVHSIEWLNGGISVQGPGVHIGNGWATESNGFKHDCDVVLEQFTGLKDRGGSEIYEGDIVKGCAKNPSDHFIVEFVSDPYNCAFMGRSVFVGGVLHICFSSMEVIGNIHQNPELLED
jgi:uncharacterized phage protein (TIGR01671 family)